MVISVAISMPSGSMPTASHSTFEDEADQWQQLRHPNVIKMYGACTAGPNLQFFVCEYASQGSLNKLADAARIGNLTVWKWLHDMALGLEYLHERRIIHGDLRCSNVLVGSDGMAKLANFRLSGSMSVASSRWQAPEVLRGEAPSHQSDVYSFGMCIIEAITGGKPWGRQPGKKVRISKMTWYPETAKYSRYEPRCPVGDVRDLTWSMCCHDPQKRLCLSSVRYELEQLSIKQNRNFSQPEKEPSSSFDTYDGGSMEDLWLKVLSYLAKSDDTQYHREIEKFKRIRELLRDSSRGHALFGHFYTLLIEFRQIIKMSPEQAQFMRLSSTRATSNSLYALHWGLNALMTSLGGAVDTPTEREEQWQQQRKELIDVFVSGVADTLLVLHNLKSTEEKLAFMRTLRTEMESATGTYTTYQLEAMEKAHAEIAHHLATDGSDNLIAEWFIPWYELVVDKWSKLGEGGFGSVFRAKWLNSDVVVKQVHVAGSTDNTNSSVFDLSDSNLSESLNQSVPETQPDATARAEMLAMFRREVEIWFGFSHPHVIRLFGACHVGKPFFVCEYATNGTLVSYLRKNPDQLWTKLYEAALGVQYLHTRGVVHGDLKGNNIVVGSDFKAKVTDFGLSSIESSDVQPIVSAAWNWLAPECLSETKARPTSASDVYSLGMCIVEALRVVEAVRSGRGTQPCFPWANPDKASVIYNASRGNLPYRPTVCKDKQWDLIKRMCALDPTHRIKISTVVDELNTISKDNRIDTSPTDCSDMNFVPELISAARQLLVRLQDNTDRRDAVYVLSLYSFLLDSLEEVKEQVGTNPATKCRTEFFRLISDAKNATAAQLQDTNESLIKYAETTMRCYALDRRLDKMCEAFSIVRNIQPPGVEIYNSNSALRSGSCYSWTSKLSWLKFFFKFKNS